MASTGPITIVGGGLAGLTLGIGLRQRGVPATVWEAGEYPRHRVCGEFISGNGLEVLDRLGLRPLLDAAGAVSLASAAFVSGPNRSPVRQLPSTALGLSRYKLDAALAEEFQRLGGELHTGSRWNSAGVQASAGSNGSEGTVRATGRQPQPTENGWRWFGLKGHATNMELSADLEMHISADNYIGVNRINNGEVNICGLFRQRTGQAPEAGFDLLHGKPDSPLGERLASARFDKSSLCSVAGLSLKPRRAADKTECCIGDSITMIPPVTGNGMSMAFESAELAIDPLARYSRGEINWAEAREAIARACDAAFAERLAWAHRLQWLMFSPVLRTPIGKFLLSADGIWNFLFAKTR
ncbi:MAG TPA: FAD-dependent monooxygenase [Verrucomicrobiae bacterium]|jgi:flavin-dependent dehydrogenase|nr:FAD-dependent monooxygenase [Verrucomicrobiae bacterium]